MIQVPPAKPFAKRASVARHPQESFLGSDCSVDMMLEKIRACGKGNHCRLEICKGASDVGYNVHAHFFWEIQFHYQEHPNAEITKILIIPPLVRHESTRMLPGKFIFCFSLGTSSFLGPHMTGTQKRMVSSRSLENLRIQLSLLQQLEQAQTSQSTREDALSAQINSFVINIIDTYQEALAKNSTFAKGDTFRQAAELIRKNACNPDFRISAVSKALGIHKSNLGRIFRKNRNITAQQYLINSRIYHACDMLSTNNFSITSIAYLTGWTYPSHFRNTFRRVTGMTPREYMLRCKNGAPFLPAGLIPKGNTPESVIDEYMRDMKKG